MDIGEKEDLASRFPGVVKELSDYGDRIRKQLGDSLTGLKGSENRQPGRVRP
jgi:arylsulfatase